METIIRFEEYTKILKKTEILKDISLEMKSGKLYKLKGTNGSGKTMLLRAIAGLIYPTTGAIYVNDVEIKKNCTYPASLGVLIENPSFWREYTGLEVLRYLANNLRFVVANRNESNKSRWKTCRFWERFLGAVEVLKLQVSKPYNSLEETQQWLTEGGVISAVKSFYFLEEHDALGGLEKVGTMLDKARYSTSLSSKLTAHLQRINRTDLIPYIQYDTKQGKGGI